MCTLTTMLFLGGWYSFINIYIFNLIPGTIWFAIKTLFFIVLFIIVRGTLPRYRYDQLMRLGWKVFLPISLAFVLILSSVMISFNFLVDIIK
jgi:NADH-quinone oxidoreductase subunit H